MRSHGNDTAHRDDNRTLPLARIAELVPVPFAMVDGGGRVLHANAELVTELQRPLVGEDLQEVVVGLSDAADVLPWLRHACGRTVLLSSGTGRVVHAKLSATVDHDGPADIAWVAFDNVTDRVWSGELGR